MAESSPNGKKGENAHYEQFLLFPQCFENPLYCRHIKKGIVQERVKTIVISLVNCLRRQSGVTAKYISIQCLYILLLEELYRTKF